MRELTDDELRAELRDCCGGDAWTRAFMEQQPFVDMSSVLSAADNAFDALTDAEWHETIAATALRAPESSGDATTEAARIAMRLYEERFGHPFVAVTSTDSADELLMRIRIRLGNEPDVEWRVTREEQRRVARMRLQRLFSGGQARAQ